MGRARRGRILLAALLLGVAVALGPNAVAAWSATPDPSSPSPDDGLTPTPQVEFDFGDLLSFVHDSPDVAKSGAELVGAIGDDKDRTATLYFTHSDLVPASVAAKAASLNVNLIVKPAAYSLAELDQAMRRLNAKYGGTLPDGFTISFYGTFDASGWSGLTLRGHYAVGSTAIPGKAIQAEAAAVAQVPVRFVASPGRFALYGG